MMDSLLIDFSLYIFWLVVTIVLFSVIVQLCKFTINKLKSSNFVRTSKLFNPLEYLPEEEISNVRQLFYLIIIVLIVVDILYSVIGWDENLIIFSVFDIVLSLYFAINVKWGPLKNKILLFGLIPLGSVGVLFFWGSYELLADAIHLITLAYFIKVYYDKFVEYTETNGLGITIMLLFSIVFVSFLITMVVEGVSPLDSLTMVSNAFTSNGYAILGDTGLGKADALLLVWSGFFLSCVGTATLTVSIVMKHFDKKFDELEALAKRNRKD